MTFQKRRPERRRFESGAAMGTTTLAGGGKANGGAGGTDAVPPFLTKTYDLVSDPGSNDVVSWNKAGKTFIVWKPAEFARDFLPKHFKHNNFSSFVRQLNTYGFRKVDPDKWEFSNDNFRKDARHLLKDIHRRKPAKGVKEEGPGKHVSTKALIEVGQYGVTETLEQLKRDREVLMRELVNVRQRQQFMESQMMEMRSRMERAESRQNSAEKNQSQIFQLVQQALNNPAMLHQLLNNVNGNMPFLESADSVSKRKKVKAKRPFSDQGLGMGGPYQQAGAGASTSYYFPEPTLPALPPSPASAQYNQFFGDQGAQHSLAQATAPMGVDQLAIEKLNLKQPREINFNQDLREEPLKLNVGAAESGNEAEGVNSIDQFLDFGPETNGT